MLHSLRDRPFTTALLIGIAAQLLFLINLQHPSNAMFDEVYYVPAARALLALDHAANPEHPLLAKEIIAGGIALFGDNVFGWRIFSTLAGTATVFGLFAILWQLYREVRIACFAAVLGIASQMVFVQARIAMLDGFMAMFTVLAVVAMLRAMNAPPGKVRLRLFETGVLLGLAVAAKWTAVPYVAFAGLAFLFVRVRDARAAGRPLVAALGSRGQRHWPGIGAVPVLLILGLTSIAAYFLTFAPAFFYANDPLTFRSLLPFQIEMWRLQTQVLPAHLYQSNWWSWPLILRPIWYFYEPDEGIWRGVLMIGNPLVMWGGLVALAGCLLAWWRRGSGIALGAAALWIGSLAVWAVIPKSLGFYYYYYCSAIWLCVAIPVAMRQWTGRRFANADIGFAAASLAMFAYFYPILAALPLAGKGSFAHWTWFLRWR